MLVGNSNVGKTAFMQRFCSDVYNAKLPSTIGLDYQQKLINNNGVKYLIQIWDTAGQERFANITPSYYRSAMGIILCYSVEDRESFNSIAVWIKQIKKYSDEQLPIIIVGNKCDLTRRQVLEKDGKAVADHYGVEFMEASAK
jgi:Ras-related protein Rab-8A